MTAPSDVAPFFFARLRVDAGADARAIRRAYARELKLIDQAADPEAFQYLRECYERALDVAAQKAHEHGAEDGADTAGPDDAPVPAPSAAVAATAAASSEATAVASSEATAAATRATAAAATAQAPAAPAADAGQADPFAQARGVFDDLRHAISVALDTPGAHGAFDASEPGAWIALLEGGLADARLAHLEARFVFEMQVAHLLASGWRPGHEELFAAAIRVFGWNTDRRAVERLRQSGQVLDAALDQHAAFAAQPAKTRAVQQQVLTCLRQPAPPSEDTMWRLAGPLRTLAERFPHWLGVVASRDAAHHWLARCAQPAHASAMPNAAGAATTPSGEPRLASMRARPAWIMWALLGFLCLMLFMLYMGASHRDSDDAARQPAWPFRVGAAPYRPAPAPEVPLSRAQIDAIRTHIFYTPAPGVPVQEQAVVYQVYLEADGRVFGMNRLRLPADPAYGVAVEQAIRALGPYPDNMVKTFRIGFRWTPGKHAAMRHTAPASVGGRTPSWLKGKPATGAADPDAHETWDRFADPDRRRDRRSLGLDNVAPADTGLQTK